MYFKFKTKKKMSLNQKVGPSFGGGGRVGTFNNVLSLIEKRRRKKHKKHNKMISSNPKEIKTYLK